MKEFKTLNLLFLVVVLFASCTYEPLEKSPFSVPTNGISFTSDIVPIFADRSCTSCHPSVANLDLTEEKAYSSISPDRVDLENPVNSLIYLKALQASGHAEVYTDQQAAYILKWIEEGALEN